MAGLVIHGGLQGWWIIDILGSLNKEFITLAGMILTIFNDNASISYLASLIPDLSNSLKYSIIAGVASGGGLTVIANAPNPAGLVILKKHYRYGVSISRLFFYALIPSLLFCCLFYFL